MGAVPQYATYGSIHSTGVERRSSTKLNTVLSGVAMMLALGALVALANNANQPDELVENTQLAALDKETLNAAAESDKALNSAPTMTKELKDVVAKVKSEWDAYAKKSADDAMTAAKKAYETDLAAAKKADSAARSKMGLKVPKYAEVKPYGQESSSSSSAAASASSA